MKTVINTPRSEQFRVEYWDKKLGWSQSPPKVTLRAPRIKRRLTLNGQVVDPGAVLELALGGKRWARVRYRECERVYRHLGAGLPGETPVPIFTMELGGPAGYTLIQVPLEAWFRWPEEAA